MKVAIIGAINFDSLEYHIHDELITQGHTARIFDFKTIVSKKITMAFSLVNDKFVERQNRNLLTEILEYKPDLVIGVYRHIHPLVVKGVKNEGIRIIHVNPDQLTTLLNQQLFVEPYDAYFTKDPFMVRFMKDKLNLNANLYSEAFNPRIHKRPNIDSFELEKEIGIDVLCFGNLYPYRNRMLHVLKDKEINLTMYGHKAKYFDSYLESNYKNKGIYGEEKAKVLNGSKIVFNNFHYAEIESVNNKFFEISGSGAFQICDYKPILDTLLPINPKLVSFNTMNEAENLIKYYLDNPEKRHEMRDVIRTHFLANFTYENLLKTILN